MRLDEFSLIEQYFQRSSSRDDVLYGIGDDAAVVSVPRGYELVTAVDTLVAGVHFPVAGQPYDIGYKALAVNLSDLAAMGAEPAWATLALTLPEADAGWLDDFTRGFFALAGEYNVALVGGDTTRGPLTVTLQLQGLVPAGQSVMRGGAQPGDHLLVTGTLGDAGLGLAYAQGDRSGNGEAVDYVLRRLNRPEPRVEAGVALRSLASAMIDISDGTLADLQHILDASGCGATVQVDDLPRSTPFQMLVSADQAEWYSLPLQAGDDFELLFSVPETQLEEVRRSLSGVPLTPIGRIESAPGLRCIDRHGTPFTIEKTGYRHFD